MVAVIFYRMLPYQETFSYVPDTHISINNSCRTLQNRSLIGYILLLKQIDVLVILALCSSLLSIFVYYLIRSWLRYCH